MSRVSLTIKNAWIAFIFQLIYITIQFFSRDIFLNKLGDEFIGTVETLKSILQFLNLSELGIGTAVGFALYKPIYENNQRLINEIIGYLGFLYKKIGLFVLIAGLFLLLFFPYIFENSSINFILIIFLFLALLTSNLLSYFFAYYMFLLQADQKGYINITINQSVFVLRLSLQCLVLIYLEDIVLWILLELLTPLLYVVILRKKIKKIYPWLNFKFKITKDVRRNHRDLLKKIKQISFHKLGTFVSNGTDNIIIFSFVNPSAVAFVSNYQMVMNNINLLVSKLFEGTNASVGHLVAENDPKNMQKVFWEFMALRFFFAGCSMVLIYISFDDLIRFWLGEKYLLSQKILIALILIFFILQIRQPIDSFKQAFGLYDDVWAPVIQSIINLLFSIIFVIKYGILGVFFGTIISQFIIVMLWRPYYVFKFGFKITNSIYWYGLGFHILYLLATFVLYINLIKYIGLSANFNLIGLFFNAVKSGLLFFILYFSILVTFSRGFKNLTNRFYQIIKNKFF